MKKQIRTRAVAMTRKFPAAPFFSAGHAEGAKYSAAELCVLSRRSLWNLLLFLLISMAAFSAQDFNLFAAVSEEFWPILGAPPPPQFIQFALIISIFCALTLLPDRLNKASLAQGWVQVGYRTTFYLFYLTANALAANFMMVFAAGLLLYGLEQSYLLLHMFMGRQGADTQINQRK